VTVVGARVASPVSHLQVAAAARLSVPLDGGRPLFGFLGELALRRRRWLLAIAGGVDQANEATLGMATLSMRRAPLYALVGYEPPVGPGAFRLQLGALVELWSLRSDGIARPDTATIVHPGIAVAAAYHFRLGRWIDLFTAVDFEYVIVRESIQIDALGELARTPSFWFAASVGASINFL
jgi:hypothetical protein